MAEEMSYPMTCMDTSDANRQKRERERERKRRRMEGEWVGRERE
jgi:hypothetical protein